MSISNSISNDKNPQTSILSVPWVVAPKIVVIPGDSAPQYNAAAQIDANHTALRTSGRDLDGKFAPLEKLITPKQAVRKLNKSSQRLNTAIDRMQSIESW